MENLNFDNDAIIDPKDEAIENLRQQLAEANRRDAFKADQLDQLGDAIMGVIGDKLEAVIDSRVGDLVENAMNDFDIHDYQGDIDDMINDRLPAVQDEDDHREAVEAIVRDILSGATVTIDV
jgi:hypothetical protein